MFQVTYAGEQVENTDVLVVAAEIHQMRDAEIAIADLRPGGRTFHLTINELGGIHETYGGRYQRSRVGRQKHAARMQRYRDRRKKVTQQASLVPPVDVLLTLVAAPSTNAAATLDTVPVRTRSHCHFCGRRCSEFVRSGFLDGRPIGCPPRPSKLTRRREGKHGHSP